MQFETILKGSYSALSVKMNPGEVVQSEPGAMVTMAGDISMDTGMGDGGILGALKRSFLGGESFFMNKYRANSSAEILFAPQLPGDIDIIDVRDSIFVQSSSYLCSETTLSMDVKFGGMKNFFAGEGLFLLHLVGNGKLAVSSFGGIIKKTLVSGEQLVVDTGHIVAFDSTMNYEVKPVGGFKSTLFSGEGLITKFTGPGTVYIQSRNYPAFVSWIKSLVPNQTGAR